MKQVIVQFKTLDQTQTTNSRLDLSQVQYVPFVSIFNSDTGISSQPLKYDVVTFDKNIIVDSNVTTNILNLVHPGSAILLFIVIGEDNVQYTLHKEIVIFDPWFRNNYQRLIGDYDAKQIGQGTYADIMFKACFEMYDTLLAYLDDAQRITDPFFTRSDFVNIIGKTMNMMKVDFSKDNTTLEATATTLYRELLANLYDLINVRGTVFCYELFFESLGYDIVLYEFWYDNTGNLVSIDPNDDSKSTYLRYNVNGMELATTHFDPRSNASPTNAYNYCSKSPYIKTLLTPKSNDYTIPTNTLVYYLNLLKPEHLIYLNEIFGINFNSEVLNKNFFPTYRVNDVDPTFAFIRTMLGYVGGPWYYANDTINEIPAKLASNYTVGKDPLTGEIIPADPGNQDYVGGMGGPGGIWQLAFSADLNKNWYSGGGFVVDSLQHLVEESNSFIVSSPKQLSDVVITRAKYDTGKVYDSKAQGIPNPTMYDAGIMLNDLGVTNVVDLKIFEADYNYFLTYNGQNSKEQIIKLMMTTIGVKGLPPYKTLTYRDFINITGILGF